MWFAGVGGEGFVIAFWTAGVTSPNETCRLVLDPRANMQEEQLT
jgi:hypothetical protein